MKDCILCVNKWPGHAGLEKHVTYMLCDPEPVEMFKVEVNAVMNYTLKKKVARITINK